MSNRGLALLALLMPLTVSVALAADSVPANVGKVEAIEMHRGAPDSKPLSTGTVVGGIAGGVIGNQFGSGRGKTAATVAGAIAGGVVGNQVEKNQAQTTRYRIVIRLDSGSTLVVEDTSDENLRVGDRVRVEGNQITRL